MALSSDLISQFVKITNDNTKPVEETTVYGTTVEYNGETYVKLDGSELLTPVNKTAHTQTGERVTVMIKNHTATITGNISSPAARIGDIYDVSDELSVFEIIIADKVDTKDFVAEKGRVDTLIIDNATVKETLTVAEANIDKLQANEADITGRLTAAEADIVDLSTKKLSAEVADITYATIENLNATNADIHNLEATYGEFEKLTTDKFTAVDASIGNLDADKLNADTAEITYAKITDLDAMDADVNTLKADVADIDTLIFGSASGNVIQSSFANAVIAQLGDAQIKSAMIENVAAGKITAGDIITNNVRVRSEDGLLLISDETIQISDTNRVRVQIGKDAADDYSINIWDADGNLMFSKGGITDSAIKEAIIRNDMVSDTANISAHKLDIDSLFEVINEDGSNTLNSSKVLIDADNQTLDVAFKSVTTKVETAQSSADTAQSTAENAQAAADTAQATADTAQATANQNASDMATIVTNFNADITNLQNQIDGSITTWFYDVGPTTNNEPAINWTTTDLKNTHLGDLYYDTTTGYCYRWQVLNNEYSWQKITDTDITKALSDAQTAQDTADQKRRVFYTQPTTPYDAGDLWVQGSTGDILRCQTAKTSSQTYALTDWVPASKYTDDTAANAAQATADQNTSDISTLKTTVSSQGTDISVIQGQISSKVWQQDIVTAKNEIGETTDELSSKYSSLEQEVDSISTTVASHSTQISNKAESSTVTAVSDKVTNLETNLSGFKTSVSNTYATKTEVEVLEIGGRNLFKGYDESEIQIYDYKGVGSFRQFFNCLTFNPCETVGETYTISFWAKSPNGTTPLSIYNRNQEPRHFFFESRTLTNTLGTEWEYFTTTVTNTDRGEEYSDSICNRIEIYAPNQLGVLVKKIKVEKGTKATDWTPAPEDVRSSIDAVQAVADAAQLAANQNAADMANIVTNFNADVQNLQTQIDGSITTWFYEVTPTDTNEPAVNWTSTDLKNIHLGDLYYDTITGYCYRYQVQNNVYSWQRITDTDVTKALSDAQAAQDTADQKRRVFYTQPVPPYDAGDLWVQGSGGDILRCKTAKVSGQSYSLSDWIAASKYTDDTVANKANSNAIAAQNAAANAQSDIDNLTIGGRNLLLDSATILLTGSDNGNNNISVVENGYVKFTAVADGNVYNNNGAVKTAVTREKGKEYTLSFEVLSPTKIGYYWYPSEKYTKSNAISASESWQKVIFTYTQTGEDTTGSTLFGFNGLTTGETYYYRNLKLELGNRATDWTPAPEDFESEITIVTERISNAESSIVQNTNAIALTVTKTEASKTYATKTELNNAENDAASKYATKTELSTAQSELTSSIELKEDSILSTVSSTYATKNELSTAKSDMSSTIEQTESSILSSVSTTYATKSALSTTNSNVTAAKAAADAAQDDIDNLQIGGRNLFRGYDDSEIQLDDYQNTGSFTQFIGNLTFDPAETVGETYTISFWAKSPNGSTPLSIYNQNGQPRYFYFPRTLMTSALGSEWEYFTYTLTNTDMGESYTGTYNNRLEFYASAQMGVLVKKIKVELGNRATDWSPAPEDMATEGDVTAVQTSVEATNDRVTTTESLIQQLSDSIMTLVTDGNGESLMVQTETGWTFSTSQIQSVIDTTSENLDNLTNEMGDVNTTVDALQQAVDDLGILNEYVKISTYEGEPCIELGENDSDFKLLITNTRIMFMEGTSVPAYINNQSLYIKKAVVEEELQQGEFVWKVRSNGNMGLVWKGASS